MERTRLFGIYSRILGLAARAYYLYGYQHGKIKNNQTKKDKRWRSEHEFNKYMAPER
jgi:hypothetical protein